MEETENMQGEEIIEDARIAFDKPGVCKPYQK